MDYEPHVNLLNLAQFFALIGFIAVSGFVSWCWRRIKIEKHLKTCTHATTYTGGGRCPGCGLKATEENLKRALVDLEHNR